MPELLTGRDLAVALYKVGLAPFGAERFIYNSEPTDVFLWHALTPHADETGSCEWKPWCCLCCVQHLLAEFCITIRWMHYPERSEGAWCWSIGQDQRWWVDYVLIEAGQEYLLALAVANVALQCRIPAKEG